MHYIVSTQRSFELASLFSFSFSFCFCFPLFDRLSLSTLNSWSIYFPSLLLIWLLLYNALFYFYFCFYLNSVFQDLILLFEIFDIKFFIFSFSVLFFVSRSVFIFSLCLFLCLLLFLFCIKFAKNRKLLKEGSKIHFTDPFYNKNIC
jgi:hypothetical protein